MATAPAQAHSPEELLKITDRPTPELVGGMLVERQPMGQEADEIGVNILTILKGFSKAVLPGIVNGPEAGYQIFTDDPRKVRFPDASFTIRERAPGRKAARGFSKTLPDLVVEVILPHDDAETLHEKLSDYLAAGVPMIWIVSPRSRHVQVCRADRSSRIVNAEETLEGGDALPGFHCRVADFFE